MKNNDLSIFDVFLYIYRANLFKFILYSIIITIILSPIFLLLQKNLINEGYKRIDVEILQLDDFAFQDILLYEKINTLYQDIMKRNIDTDLNDFFFNQFFNRDRFFYMYYDYFTKNKNIREINNKHGNSFSFFGSSSPVPINTSFSSPKVLAKLKKQTFTATFSTNVDTSENLIDDFIENIDIQTTNFVDNEFNRMKLDFEKNNIFILENMYAKFEEELEARINNLPKIKEDNELKDDNNDVYQKFYNEQNVIISEIEIYLVLIKKYLSKLESTNEEYIGNLISNSKLSVAEIKSIKTNNVNSNFNFIIIRSILLSLIISILFIFFFFLFRLNYLSNKS